MSGCLVHGRAPCACRAREFLERRQLNRDGADFAPRNDVSEDHLKWEAGDFTCRQADYPGATFIPPAFLGPLRERIALWLAPWLGES